MKLQPLGARILVSRTPPEQRSKGGILLPEQTQEKSATGEVIAVGPGTDDEPMTLKVGQVVLFGKWGGQEVPDSKELVILNQSEVLATVQ